jgi:hypothetical protein
MTSPAKPPIFPDNIQFWYETKRAFGASSYGASEFGEVLATGNRIKPLRSSLRAPQSRGTLQDDLRYVNKADVSKAERIRYHQPPPNAWYSCT